MPLFAEAIKPTILGKPSLVGHPNGVRSGAVVVGGQETLPIVSESEAVPSEYKEAYIVKEEGVGSDEQCDDIARNASVEIKTASYSGTGVVVWVHEPPHFDPGAYYLFTTQHVLISTLEDDSSFNPREIQRKSLDPSFYALKNGKSHSIGTQGALCTSSVPRKGEAVLLPLKTNLGAQALKLNMSSISTKSSRVKGYGFSAANQFGVYEAAHVKSRPFSGLKKSELVKGDMKDGMSGGPVLDAKSCGVIGLNTSTLKGARSWAEFSSLKSLLKKPVPCSQIKANGKSSLVSAQRVRRSRSVQKKPRIQLKLPQFKIGKGIQRIFQRKTKKK